MRHLSHKLSFKSNTVTPWVCTDLRLEVENVHDMEDVQIRARPIGMPERMPSEYAAGFPHWDPTQSHYLSSS